MTLNNIKVTSVIGEIFEGAKHIQGYIPIIFRLKNMKSFFDAKLSVWFRIVNQI